VQRNNACPRPAFPLARRSAAIIAAAPRRGWGRELDGPALLLARVDLEEAAAVEAAGEAILDAPDREFAVAGAHEGAPAPFAAAVVIDREHVEETGRQRSLEQGFAAARVQVPPALGDPSLRVAIADRDADAARGHVAQAQVGAGRCRGDQGGEDETGEDRAEAGEAPARFRHRARRMWAPRLSQ
jgi:hypothetical protein